MELIKTIRSQLKQNVDEKYKDGAKRYFKEKIKLYGVRTPIVTKIAKESYKQIKHLPKKDVFALCDELLRSGYMEESYIAFKWTQFLKTYGQGDFKIMERWLKDYVNNWASCDSLCNHALGSLVEQYPQRIAQLKKWTKSKNRWLRRASVVTLVLPARRGLFLEDSFEIATLLLHDDDDLVQKGYGWLLKEASRKHQREVFDFVVKHKKTMPRTALRYAIEKMPDKLRKEAMKK